MSSSGDHLSDKMFEFDFGAITGVGLGRVGSLLSADVVFDRYDDEGRRDGSFRSCDSSPLNKSCGDNSGASPNGPWGFTGNPGDRSETALKAVPVTCVDLG